MGWSAVLALLWTVATADKALESGFVADYVAFENYPKAVTAFLCWNPGKEPDGHPG